MITTRVFDKTDDFDLEVDPNTRNSKGFFIKDLAYRLVEVDKAGWALICPDNAMCHYVDPECLHKRN